MKFSSALNMGWDHIVDFSAYDHILFIVVLCALYSYFEWRKLITIITAFTIGHSISLLLSALDIFVLSSKLVEVLIPATIIFTAISNILIQSDEVSTRVFSKKGIKNYCIALCFGLIHGMGFANNFKFLLGNSDGIVMHLFAFNFGIELGQLMIVLCLFVIYYFFIKYCKIKQREWVLFVSGAGFGVGLILCLTNLLNF